MSRTKTDKLSARWDAVPSERQEAYRRIYQRELREAGATTDDAAELAVLMRLITAFKEQGLVPIGSRWVSVPPRVQRAAKRGQPLTGFDTPSADNGPPRAALVLLIPIVGLLLLMLFNLTGGDNDANATLTPEATPTETPTPTPEVSPTPTPLALEESDRFIEAGQTSNRDYFPVLLQIDPADGSPARVFVVQERAVDTADWRYSSNPDVASWVSGLLVKPVFGLPFSEDNAELMASLAPGTRFTLQMNTGAELDFIYADTTRVIRQQTDVFHQVEPGIALILIGETDADGLLTEERLVVTGSYPVEQEVERLRAGELMPIVPFGQPGAVAGNDGLQVIAVSTAMLMTDGLPDDLAYVLIDLNVMTGADVLRTSGLRWLLEDAAGNRYSPDVNAGTLATYAPLPGEVVPHTGLQTSIGFLVPRTLTTAQLLISLPGQDPTAFAMTVEPPITPPTVHDLDVQIRSAQVDQNGVYLDIRLFNPLDSAILLADEIPWLILGYTVDPIGPQLIPRSQNIIPNLPAGMVSNIYLEFPYTGEAYGKLMLLGREYILHISESTDITERR